MAEKEVKTHSETETESGISRVYEVGYHIIPTAKEEDLEAKIAPIRSLIEKHGGSFIAEGAPALMRLAYSMTAREGEKKVMHDRGYFGWLKFDAPTAVAHELEEMLKADANVLRHIVFRTVREDTRAKYKAPQLREVKRTDTIKMAPRRTEESAAPVSEEDLEKALQDITAE